MGMFDSVMVTCPHCKKKTEVQSKAGRCDLEQYDETDVPVIVAVSLVDYLEGCGHCQKQFYVKADVPETCRVRGGLPKTTVEDRLAAEENEEDA